MKSLIFLDMDGVLNNKTFIQQNNFSDVSCIDPEKIKIINKIIEKTNADIVISSIWRFYYTLDELREILKNKGLIGNIIDTTKTVECFCDRGKEIETWLEEHPGYDKFVIIDDEDDMCELYPFLVKTNFEIGIEEKHIQEVLIVLNYYD